MERADVVVAGAGPAGAIAARVLARAGADVLLLEARSFPRPKVCGDALIPDSLALLREEGLLETVSPHAHAAEAIRVFAPSGRSVRLSAPFLTIRREHLDAMLVEAAVAAGARLVENARVSGPRRDGAGVISGLYAERGGERYEVEAPLTILATGAASGMLEAFGVRTRRQPSALALRAYWRVPALDPTELIISFERSMLPAYGWVFPMRDGEANIGVSLFLDNGRTGENLRDLFVRFTTQCPHMRDVLLGAEPLGDVRGAPLRCALEGAEALGAGLLVAGEALGTTYSLSGEGIGKAMESGRLAARAALVALEVGRFDRATLARYEVSLRDAHFPQKFAQYKEAQRWMNRSWAANLLTWRAQHSQGVRGALEAVLREEVAPSDVMSTRGLLRTLVL